MLETLAPPRPPSLRHLSLVFNLLLCRCYPPLSKHYVINSEAPHFTLGPPRPPPQKFYKIHFLCIFLRTSRFTTEVLVVSGHILLGKLVFDLLLCRCYPPVSEHYINNSEAIISRQTRTPHHRFPATILAISRDTCSDSIARLFRASFYGVSCKYRGICCKMGYRTDVAV